MTMRAAVRLQRWATASALVFGTISADTLAGPLDPPAGPVAPTMKTLDEVRPGTAIGALPYSITVPGAYYLSGNLDFQGSGPAISVDAADVTLDLSGFTLSGPGPAGLGNDGVRTGAVGTNFRLCNGSIKGFNIGVHAPARDAQILGVRVSGCFNGIVAAAVLVSECSAFENGGVGITTLASLYVIPDFGTVSSGAAVVERCSATANGEAGFLIGEGTLLVDSSASVNKRYGINSTGTCRIQRCSVVGTVFDGEANQPGYGIGLATGSNVTDTTVRSCASGGIFLASSRNAVKGCNVSANGDFGIGGPGFANAIANGYYADISDCHVSGHTGYGIALVSDCSIRNNTVINNAGSGIAMSGGGNRMIGNQCRGNGTAGGSFNFTGQIAVFGDRNHIEANACNNGPWNGIFILSTRNVVIRNVCGGNPNANYVMGSGDIAGPIVNRVASGGAIGTSDPSANISY
ncbi:MAG: right-handed parallel beta-helix repeat-containing protein [Phycisphaerales bacterium]